VWRYGLFDEISEVSFATSPCKRVLTVRLRFRQVLVTRTENPCRCSSAVVHVLGAEEPCVHVPAPTVPQHIS
jgi:hypothetical protein